MMEKNREFWIVPQESNNYLGYDYLPENKAIQLLCVHVVEFKAYQELQDKIQRLEACLEKCIEQRNWYVECSDGNRLEKVANYDKELTKILNDAREGDLP